MSTIAFALLMGCTTLASAIMGALAVVAYRRLWPSRDATVEALRAQLEVEQTRRRMAEHRLAFWIGLRDTTVIVVELRRGQG